jgi:CheY-like chemotaxis protein
MEALGRLAGGIAHDFNNVLAVILGYADLLLRGDSGGARGREHLLEIRKAGERARSMTRQLLAFSRKQVLKAEVFELGELVDDMKLMLRSLLGEDIELRVVRRGAPAMLELDPGQIQRLILNLAGNARDAMPGGGRLTIVVENVDLATGAGRGGGSFVRLTVADTGPGMDAETRRRAFDPFFTTKEPGKGTGLGLSSVYGIVQQSGGRIQVDTAPGEGASFVILLPRALGASPGKAPPAEAAENGPARGSETLLLVEDNEQVLRFMHKLLASRGYRVLEARDGRSALRIAQAYAGKIDALVTDVVMPGMSGPELAQALLAERPETKVLFVSAYPGDALVRRGGAGAEHAFLHKPFGAEELARKLRAVLEGAEAAEPVG